MAKFLTYPIGSPYKRISTTTAGSAISTTGIQLLNSVLVPANTFIAGDIFTIEGAVSKSNTLGTLTPYFYWNTSVSLSGATLLSTGTANANTTRYILSIRTLQVVNASNNTLLPSTTGAANSGYGPVAGTVSSVSLNWTNASYIILAANHTSASESVTGEWLRVGNY